MKIRSVGHIEVMCGACENKFNLYAKDEPKDNTKCPYCGASLGKHYTEKLFKAFRAIEEVNKDFLQSHIASWDEPLFIAEYKSANYDELIEQAREEHTENAL